MLSIKFSVLQAMVSLLWLSWVAFVASDQLIYVDDTDPRIVYNGNWSHSANTKATATRWNKTTHWADQVNDSAMFKIKATGMKFMGFGVLSPDFAPITIIFDGQSETVNMLVADQDSRSQAILWEKSGLDYVEHSITVMVVNPGLDVNLDAFLYTTPDMQTTSSLESPTSSTTSPTSDPAAELPQPSTSDSQTVAPVSSTVQNGHSRLTTSAIAGLAVGAFIGALFLCSIAWLVWDRRRKGIALAKITSRYQAQIEEPRTTQTPTGSTHIIMSAEMRKNTPALTPASTLIPVRPSTDISTIAPTEFQRPPSYHP